jgi:hypothetical protein
MQSAFVNDLTLSFMNRYATRLGVYGRTRLGVLAVMALLAYGCDSGSSRIASYDDCVLEHSKGIASSTLLDTIKVSCKQKYPKTFDLAAIAKNANTLDWSEVAAMEEIRTLSSDQKDGARNQYFLDVIRPRIHPDFVAEAKIQFDSFASRAEKRIAGTAVSQTEGTAKPPLSVARPQVASPSKAFPLPLPQNGQPFTFNSEQRIAPFSIVTRDSTRNFFVKLEDWNTGQPVYGVFIRAGQSVETTVPLGTFRLKYATGIHWYGEGELFGTDTTYHEADRRFNFSQTDEKIAGYTVELYLQPHGNLKTVRTDRAKW